MKRSIAVVISSSRHLYSITTPGNIDTLNDYGNKAYLRNLAMLGAVDTIDKVFSVGSSAKPSTPALVAKMESLARLRSLGLLGVHGAGPLKNAIAKYAMGIY